MQYHDLILKLNEIGAIKFGAFTLKSGLISPIYVDLRLIVSYPELLSDISEAIWSKIAEIEFDLLCGVPYTALPIATALSLAHAKPMVMRRKEAKDHGTKKMIEGVFRPGETCLIIEDIITSGSSIFETIAQLEKESLLVRDVAVFIDREQGGRQHLVENGLQLHPVFTLTEIIDILYDRQCLDVSMASQVRQFLSQNQVYV